MEANGGRQGGSAVPKRREKHHSFDESVDESEKLIEDEPVDIETEAPAEENSPIEGVDKDNAVESPAFDD